VKGGGQEERKNKWKGKKGRERKRREIGFVKKWHSYPYTSYTSLCNLVI